MKGDGNDTPSTLRWRDRMCPGDRIVTAYAEHAEGPGWGNSPVWVIVRSAAGVVREECIQPHEMSPEMYVLYRVSEATHSAMAGAVKRLLECK